MSDSEPQVVILDTSVLIADPDALEGFGDAAIVLPLVCVEELDNLKTREGEVGWAARTALRKLEGYRVKGDGNIREAVPRTGGGTIRVETNSHHADEIRSFGFDPAKNDNRILGVCLGLRGQGNVALISADAALRIKAAQVGVRSEDYVPHGALDESETGWKTAHVSGDLIDRFYADGLFADDLDIPLHDNEFVVLTAPSQGALARNVRGKLHKVEYGKSAWGMKPRSKEQAFALDLLLDPDVPLVVLSGVAGTGKTMLAIAAGLEQAIENRKYSGVSVYKPIVAAGKHELGFLPGDLAEKLEPWTEAISDNLIALTDNKDEKSARNVKDALMSRGELDFGSIAHMRGRSVRNRYLIVDEAQNLEVAMLKMIATRVGENTKLVLIGDYSQIDAAYLSKNSNALSAAIQTFKGSELFGYVRLTKGERSPVAELAAKLL